MATVLDGRRLARLHNQSTRRLVAGLPRPPGLAVVMVGTDPASRIYVERKARVAERLGFAHRQVDLPPDISQERLLALVAELNRVQKVDGILVQLPLPGDLDGDAVLEAIDPAKDVDCFHPLNTGLLTLGRPRFVPCTAAAIMAILEHWGVGLSGRSATVVGRSPIVGRPVSLLLDRAGATVTVCHSRTPDLEPHVRAADILVLALGRPLAIPGRWVKPGAAVLDVGINRMPDGSLCGDLDYGHAMDRAAYITPVPGGVGPMTIAMLMRNTFLAASARQNVTPG